MRFALAFRRLKSPAGVQLVAALPTVGLRQTTDERRQRGPRAAVDRYPIKIRAKKFINQTRSWNAFNRPCRAGDSSHRFVVVVVVVAVVLIRSRGFVVDLWLLVCFLLFRSSFPTGFPFVFVSGPDSNCFVFFWGFFFFGFVSRQSQRRLWRLPIINSRLPLHYSKKKTLVSRSLSLCKPNNNNNNNSNKKKKGKKKTKQKSTTATTRNGERATHLERTVFLFCFHFYYFSPSLSVSFFLFSLVLGFLPFEAPVKRISSSSSSSSFFLLFCCCCCCCCWEETKKKKERKKEKKEKKREDTEPPVRKLTIRSAHLSLGRPQMQIDIHSPLK